MRHLTLRAVIGSVVDRLQADVTVRGKLASRNALRPFCGDAQTLGFGRSAAA